MNVALRKPEYDPAIVWRALLELRHGELRLRLALTEIEWAKSMFAAGNMAPDAALAILDNAFDDLAGTP